MKGKQEYDISCTLSYWMNEFDWKTNDVTMSSLEHKYVHLIFLIYHQYYMVIVQVNILYRERHQSFHYQKLTISVGSKYIPFKKLYNFMIKSQYSVFFVFCFWIRYLTHHHMKLFFWYGTVDMVSYRNNFNRYK